MTIDQENKCKASIMNNYFALCGYSPPLCPRALAPRVLASFTLIGRPAYQPGVANQFNINCPL